MSKSLSLIFAVTSVVLMIATAVSISYNGWLALLFAILSCANIGFGFVMKSRQTKRVSDS